MVLFGGDPQLVFMLSFLTHIHFFQVSETPSAPMSAIKKVDERLLEKLSLLEENGGKKPVEDIVTDLWSIMKQNGG